MKLPKHRINEVKERVGISSENDIEWSQDTYSVLKLCQKIVYEDEADDISIDRLKS